MVTNYDYVCKNYPDLVISCLSDGFIQGIRLDAYTDEITLCNGNTHSNNCAGCKFGRIQNSGDSSYTCQKKVVEWLNKEYTGWDNANINDGSRNSQGEITW